MNNFTEIIKENEITLVDFFATWCGPCKMMHPILEDLKKEMGEQIRIITLDIDKESNQALCAEYQIQSVPTLLLFKKGEMVWRNSGVVSLSQLSTLIKSHIGKD